MTQLSKDNNAVRLHRRSVLMKNLSGYICLTPWLIGLFVFTVIPMVTSLYLSFTKYDLFSDPSFIGLRNYAFMFKSDTQFHNSLRVTLSYVLLAVPLELAFALFLAVFLQKGVKGLRVYRAVYYIPSLFGANVAISLLWRQVFGINGLLNQVLAVFGIQGVSWIGDPRYALYTLVFLKVWQVGSPMLIFLSGLQQIPEEYYEAARIDGASKFRCFIHITFPLITPIVLFNGIMQMINTFKSFTPAYVISGGSGSPADSLMFYTLYLYRKGFLFNQMGYASALAWVLLLIVGTLTFLVFKSSGKWVHYSDEE